MGTILTILMASLTNYPSFQGTIYNFG